MSDSWDTLDFYCQTALSMVLPGKNALGSSFASGSSQPDLMQFSTLWADSLPTGTKEAHIVYGYLFNNQIRVIKYLSNLVMSKFIRQNIYLLIT